MEMGGILWPVVALLVGIIGFGEGARVGDLYNWPYFYANKYLQTEY